MSDTSSARIAGDLEGAAAQVRVARLAVLGQKAQRAPDLLMQQTQRAFQRVSDVIIDAFSGQVGRAVVGREERGAQPVDDPDHRFARRQFAYAERMARAMQFLARRAQVGDDSGQSPLVRRVVCWR
jgi:hypothetical protein